MALWRIISEIHSDIGCGFLFTFRTNYDSMVCHLRDKPRYWLKIVISSYPGCIRRTHQGALVGVFAIWHPGWCCKNYSAVATLWWKKMEHTYNPLHRIPACNGQTVTETDSLSRHSPRYARGRPATTTTVLQLPDGAWLLH